MKLSYKGKSSIITGASGGMGLEISKKLSQNNHQDGFWVLRNKTFYTLI